MNNFIGTAVLVWRIYLPTIAVERPYYLAAWVWFRLWGLGSVRWEKEAWEKADGDERMNVVQRNEVVRRCELVRWVQRVGESIWLRSIGNAFVGSYMLCALALVNSDIQVQESDTTEAEQKFFCWLHKKTKATEVAYCNTM